MFEGKKILGIIPARGGSKGLPGKNIRMLCGKPLIAWSIASALKSQCIDELMVTTDSNEIAQVAEQYGANVPFIRPDELATDEAKSVDVVAHTIDWYEERQKRYDLLMLLQPTSPLRTAEDIRNAVSLFFDKQAEAVISVCGVDHHPWWSNTLPADGSMKQFLRPEISKTNRQDLPVFYRLNGAIDLIENRLFMERRSFWPERTYAYIMPQERSIDIDSMIDFRLAELLLGGK